MGKPDLAIDYNDGMKIAKNSRDISFIQGKITVKRT